MEKSKVSRICIIGKELIEDERFVECAQSFECEVIKSVDGGEVILSDMSNMLIVVREFDDELFKQLLVSSQSIIGSTALQYYYRNNLPLTLVSRPVHNYSMRNLVICMSGFQDKEEADCLLRLLRYMGGTSRKDFTQNVTHLIAKKTSGVKYRTAVNTGIVVMSVEWIKHCWEKRFIDDFNPCDPSVISEFKMKPFTGLGLSFVNCEDTNEMEEWTVNNGGIVVELNDDRCTHVVVDAIPGEQHPSDLDTNLINKNLYVVYKEWFWASLEMAARVDEGSNEHAYPISGTKNYKRSSTDFKILSNSSGDLLSPSLDFSRSFNSSVIEGSVKSKTESSTTPKLQHCTKRRAVCLELFDTERNYVEVLQTIINVFKKPLEEPCFSEYLLDATEVRIIFGNLPPIYDVHKRILSDLQRLTENWKETAIVGNIFIKHSSSLLKAYPPFVNYFENSKETIIECDAKYPRFHAFLKKCQSKPECKRQSLTELLIRPIQRLPSVILLLTDLLKNTEKNNADHKQLNIAIEKIKDVLMHINEDKRKTEGQIAMFDIINDIEECPAVLLSAHRHFICKMDVKLLLKNESCRIVPFKGYTLTLFLFSDVLEICKKRSLKRSHSLTAKGSNRNNIPHTVGSSSKQSCKKSYRHIELLYLKSVKTVYDFSVCEGFQNAFLVIAHASAFSSNSRTFCSYPFLAEDKDIDLKDFLKKFTFQVCPNGSLQENLKQLGDLNRLIAVDFEHAEYLINGLTKSNFSLVKTKIGRAFSTRRPPLSAAVSTSSLYTPPHPNEDQRSSPSPSRRRISRAFSTLMQQLGTNSPLHSRKMSTCSLTELPDENAEITFSLPTTPAPRKKKCQTGDGSENLEL